MCGYMHVHVCVPMTDWSTSCCNVHNQNFLKYMSNGKVLTFQFVDDRMWLEGSSTIMEGCSDMSPQLAHQAEVLLFAWNNRDMRFKLSSRNSISTQD